MHTSAGKGEAVFSTLLSWFRYEDVRSGCGSLLVSMSLTYNLGFANLCIFIELVAKVSPPSNKFLSMSNKLAKTKYLPYYLLLIIRYGVVEVGEIVLIFGNGRHMCMWQTGTDACADCVVTNNVQLSLNVIRYSMKNLMDYIARSLLEVYRSGLPSLCYSSWPKKHQYISDPACYMLLDFLWFSMGMLS